MGLVVRHGPCALIGIVLLIAMAEAAPIKVVELSVGRSGSTLLMEVMSTMPQVFDIPEPYYEYANKEGDATSRVPSISSLLDCSFANRAPVINSVFWEYACKHASWLENRCEVMLMLLLVVHKVQSSVLINRTLSITNMADIMPAYREAMSRACRERRMSQKLVRKLCLNADMRVAKIIRLTWLLGISENANTTSEQVSQSIGVNT